MSDARSTILDAVRLALGRERAGRASTTPAEIAAEAAALGARIAATRPDRVTGPADQAVLDRVTSPGSAATAERSATLAELPAAVSRYLGGQGLAASVALQPHPALLALDWTGVETHGTIGVDEPAAVGLALAGIAETGSVVFHSGPAAPTLFAFLPLHHIVAVPAGSIFRWLEDYADAESGNPKPRNVNLVTGASGTTDIEGVMVKGAHGPGHLHIVLVGTADRG